MGGLASPTGYLDLEQSMIGGADEVGTGTVDGVAVTIYQVSIEPGANIPGLNAEQSQTIADADAVLQAQGYTGSTILVSIDASGFIRQTRSTAHFADGSTGGSEDTFSDFGCAGTVLMPGQSGATAPPAGCVSPDTRRRPVNGYDNVVGAIVHLDDLDDLEHHDIEHHDIELDDDDLADLSGCAITNQHDHDDNIFERGNDIDWMTNLAATVRRCSR